MSSDVTIVIGAIDKASAVLKQVSANIANLAKSTGESMKAVGKSVSQIGASVTAVGVSVTGPIALAVSRFADMADGLEEMAARTGVSVEALSELAFAAEQSGSSLETVERGIKGMQKQITAATLGSEEFGKALSQIGLRFEDIEGLSPEDQFTEIADALSDIEDPTLKAGLAMKIFGKAGADLVPLINENARGIRDLRQEARDLGRQITTQDAQAAAAYNDAWNRVKSALAGVSNQIGATLMPHLTRIANILSDIIVRLSTWMGQNRQLVIAVSAFGAGLTAIGGVIVATGGLIATLGFAFTGLATAVTAAGAVITAALSPIGLIIAGILAPVVILSGMFAVAAYRTGLLGEQVAAVGRLVRLLGKIAQQTFSGISEAIKNGDLELAMKIAMAGAKLAFFAGIESMYHSFMKIWPLMFEAAKEFFYMFGRMAIKATSYVAQAVSSPLIGGARLASALASGDFFGDVGSLSGPSDFLAQKREQARQELNQLTSQASRGSSGNEASKQVDLSQQMLEQLMKIAELSQKPAGEGTVLAVQVGP